MWWVQGHAGCLQAAPLCPRTPPAVLLTLHTVLDPTPLVSPWAVPDCARCTQPCSIRVQGHEAVWRNYLQWRPADQAAQTPDWVCDAGMVTCAHAVSHRAISYPVPTAHAMLVVFPIREPHMFVSSLLPSAVSLLVPAWAIYASAESQHLQGKHVQQLVMLSQSLVPAG